MEGRPLLPPLPFELETQREVPPGVKRCTWCAHEYPATDAYFYRYPEHSGGAFKPHCKPCQKAASAAWRASHREYAIMRDRAYAKAHKQQKRAADAVWRAKNLKRKVQINRAYKRANPARVNAWNRKYVEKHEWAVRAGLLLRYARRHGAAVLERGIDLLAIVAKYDGICYLCLNPIIKADLSFDHIVPVERGGTHTMDNLAPTHLSCNIRKGNRLLGELSGL